MSLPIASATDARRATWRLVRDDRRGMAEVLALHVPAAAAALVGPWLLGLILDRVRAGEPIGLLPLAAVAGALAQLLLLRTARRAALRFGERALGRLRERFVDRVLALPISTVERAGTGDLATRSTTDVATVGETVRDVAPDVLVAALQSVFTVVALFLIDPLLGLCVPVGLVGIPVITRWYLRRARDAYLAEGAAGSEMAEQLTATAAGGRTVEAFGLAEDRIARGAMTTAESWRARMATLALRSVFFPVCDISYAVPVALVLVLGGLRYLDGAVAFGSVAAAALYAVSLSDPFDRILERIEQLQASSAAMARITGIDGIGAAPVVRATPADDRIEVHGVHFAYDGGPPVLHGVDLVVEPGERLAVVGTSGAGKSTLGRLLAGLDAPRSGRVTLGGVDVAAAGGTLLVTQEQHVFLGTLRDNLAVAAPDADDERMRRAATTVGITWPLDTELGAGARVLDAATAQQVALARVLLADPPVVVLDEATALLDPATARHTEHRLYAVLSGRTVIAVAHRLHTAHDADRIVVMEQGRIVEDGTHDALVRVDGPYAALWRSWQGGQRG